MLFKTSCFYVLLLPVLGSQQSNVINSISKHIGNVVLECKQEMGLSKDVIDEFLAFWNPKQELTSTNQGCADACVLKKLDLLQRGGQVKRDNTITFLKANGADPEMSSKIIELLTLCTRAAITKKPADGCVLGLEIFKCFRYGIFRLHWAPELGDDNLDEMDEIPA
ncbi:unnamed protein product [Arctia plantaginis]|uniref:Uncharacterized protein n=1 Tax=Arctia plantaginis TaxID=874455 RepID=A0A8S0YL10_ARCPL|nr:unnamed protein product [Arctia plantaginis]